MGVTRLDAKMLLPGVETSEQGSLVWYSEYAALEKRWFASNKAGNQAMDERDALRAEMELMEAVIETSAIPVHTADYRAHSVALDALDKWRLENA